MKTKLIDTLLLDRDTVLHDVEHNWKRFLADKSLDNSAAARHISASFDQIKEELTNNRWFVMNDLFFFDKEICACWKGLSQNRDYFKSYKSGTDYNTVKKVVTDEYNQTQLDLPTNDELYNSLTRLTAAPFGLSYKRPSIYRYLLYKNNDSVQGFDVHADCYSNNSSGYAVPLIRLANENTFKLKDKEIFFLWVVNGFTPESLANNRDYAYLLHNFNYQTADPSAIASFSVGHSSEGITESADFITESLLQEDHIRADIQPYHQKMLEDIEQGHWSLWALEKKCTNNPIKVSLEHKLVARDPSSRIVDGVVGIDFGTKSTVVAYQEETTQTQLMRVGIGDLSKEVAAYHYENPTIMEFNDLERFISAYQSRAGRPFTQWKDLTISHTAFNSLINSKADDFNTFVSELKQWAGDKNRHLKLIDKQRKVTDLGSFLALDLAADTINPIELYAYYLGLYINNQHNGIFMNYILSFPVTYEVEIRNKIIASFEKGIKKSLPLELHLQDGAVEQLSVIKGASEPAAYAVIALQEYGFEPVNDEKVFYGIFDFGGGTTDFDFGIYTEAKGKHQRRYDYVIEHFGAGGDRYLGGENLLELLAFEVFKDNKDSLLEQSLQFILPPECKKFAGSETLLSTSREAKMNTKMLMEKLRPFWEGQDSSEIESGAVSLNLTTTSGEMLAGCGLDVDIEALKTVLQRRIKKGVVSFFDALREAVSDSHIELKDIDIINIFLAGNSSQSTILAQLFDEEIATRSAEIKQQLQYADSKEIFKVFPPLGGDSADDSEKPTGKTGVAFGLIETRKGGKTLVIDHNTDENNINFRYYLGMNRRKKFRVVIDRNTAYNQWINFIDASEDTFEVYYASISSASTNELAIADNSIKKKMLKIDGVDDNASVFIRLINATEFEYVVANDDCVHSDEFLGNIKKVSL